MKVVEGYLGSDILVEGKLFSKHGTRIDGSLMGQVICLSSVDIGISAVIRGNVHAESVRVSGLMEGEVRASRKLSILERGLVRGKLMAPPGGLSMDQGSQLEGTILMEPVQAPRLEETSATTEVQEETPAEDGAT